MKTQITVTKERTYGTFSRGAKYFYRASLGSIDLATGATKDEALAAAWKQITDTQEQSMARVRVAVSKDGTVMTAREYQTGQVEVAYHRPLAGELLYDDNGSCMSSLERDGKKITLREYLANQIARYDECTAAA